MQKSIILVRFSFSAALFFFSIFGRLHAQSFYADDFSDSGALNGRPTAPGFGSWTNADGALQVGGGQIQINSNAPYDWHSATFALPTLTSSDTLSLILTVRPSGQNFMGIGFTPNAGQYVANSGYGWLYYQGLGAPYPNIQIFTGSANGGSVGQVYSAGLENPNVNFDASLPTTFRYTYSASAKTLSITAENGTRSSTLLNNLDVSSVPLSGFSNFALQFQGQTLDSDSNPSFVERLQVEIIPANQKPVISPAQTFSVSENSAVGFAVGTLSASDADSNPLSGWTILSGDSSGAFALDSSTGQLTVLGNLNYEATPLYTLSITVSDGTATSDPVDVTVNVLNMPEYSDVFASADPAADANQDGISNLMAYALGATSSSSRVASPGLILSPSNLTLTALVRTNDPKLTVWGNVTTNLNNWPTNTFAGTPTADQSGAVPGVTQRQEFSVPRGTDPKLFLRLKANLNP